MPNEKILSQYKTYNENKEDLRIQIHNLVNEKVKLIDEIIKEIERSNIDERQRNQKTNEYTKHKVKVKCVESQAIRIIDDFAENFKMYEGQTELYGKLSFIQKYGETGRDLNQLIKNYEKEFKDTTSQAITQLQKLSKGVTEINIPHFTQTTTAGPGPALTDTNTSVEFTAGAGAGAGASIPITAAAGAGASIPASSRPTFETLSIASPDELAPSATTPIPSPAIGLPPILEAAAAIVNKNPSQQSTLSARG